MRSLEVIRREDVVAAAAARPNSVHRLLANLKRKEQRERMYARAQLANADRARASSLAAADAFAEAIRVVERWARKRGVL